MEDLMLHASDPPWPGAIIFRKRNPPPSKNPSRAGSKGRNEFLSIPRWPRGKRDRKRDRLFRHGRSRASPHRPHYVRRSHRSAYYPRRSACCSLFNDVFRLDPGFCRRRSRLHRRTVGLNRERALRCSSPSPAVSRYRAL